MPGTERWVRFTIGVVLTAAAAYLLYRLRFVLVTVALSAMLAYAVLPVVELVSRLRVTGRPIPRLAAVTAVYLLLILLAVVVVRSAAGAVANDVHRLALRVPEYRDEVARALGDLPGMLIDSFPDDLRQAVQDAFSRAGTLLVDTLAKFAAATAKWLGLAAELLLIPLLAFYFLVDLPALNQELLQFVPTSWRPRVLLSANRLDRILAAYVRGQIVLMVVAAVVVWAGLIAVQMPFALILGLVAGVTRIIPVVGPFLGTIPIVTLALLQSPTLGVEVLVFLIVVQLLESKVLLPAVMGRQLDLRAATIIVSLLIATALFGPVGAFLAAPVAAAIKEIMTLAEGGFGERA
jgi:predicted PurR-regulated permease PerM